MVGLTLNAKKKKKENTKEKNTFCAKNDSPRAI